MAAKTNTASQADVKAYVADVLKKSAQRGPGETEFQQASGVILNSIVPVLEQHPEFIEAKILDRLIEPERQIMFRVPWVDDAGNIQVNRGYRIEFNSALGPYKGGLRFHPSVNISIIKFLGFEQIFKNALTAQNIGGGKGGSDFDPHGKSDAEVMRFCQSFMSELYRHIGLNTDVPAGDIGVGGREVGFLFGQYRKLTNRYDAGVLTGKSLVWSGAQIRTEATGYGAVFFAQEMLKVKGDSVEGKRAVVSGAGNVAIYTIEKLQQLGAKPVTASDSSGYIVDEDGIDLDLLKQIKEVEKARISEYAKRKPEAKFVADGSIWDVPADLAFPSATQNELDKAGAEALVAHGVKAVTEGANMPTTPEAVAVLRKAGVLYGPGKAANAGGVAVSALEMEQNAARASWDREQSEAKLLAIMQNIHSESYKASERYGTPGDYILGANSAAFVKIAQAMLDQGLI